MSSIRFVYLRDKRDQPISCIAVSYDKEDKKISFAISTLNPKDKFNKKLGREVAEGRLIKTPYTIVLTKESSEITAHYITRCILEDLNMWSEGTLPARTRKAALRWLEQAAKKSNKTKMNITSQDDYITL